jgi:hypothetical protein
VPEPDHDQEGEAEENPSGERWVPLTGLVAPPQASALEDALDEAGIPTLVLQPNDQMIGLVSGSATPAYMNEQVTVPESRVRDALQVVQRVEAQAVERGMKDAFDPVSIDERLHDPKGDQLLKRTAATATLPPEERHEVLAGLVADMLAFEVGDIRMAQCLAAAGLNEDEATRLVAEVVRERADLFEKSRRRLLTAGRASSVSGILLLLLSLCLLIPRWQSAPALAFSGHESWMLVTGLVSTCIGTGLIQRARRMRNPAQRPEGN